MSDWEPATEVEAAMRDALRVGDQEHYFRLLARTELILPVAADALAGRAPVGWGTWTTDSRTHVLAFTSPQALDACLAEHAGTYRKLPFHELAASWPELEWWLAVNPGLPIEGYLPAWFVAQISRGDVRLPGRTLGARARIEQATALRSRTSGGAPQPPAPPVAPSSPVPPAAPSSPVPLAAPSSPIPSSPVPPAQPAADPAVGRVAGAAALPADSFARPGGRDFPRRGDLLSRRGFPRRGAPGEGPPARGDISGGSDSTFGQQPGPRFGVPAGDAAPREAPAPGYEPPAPGYEPPAPGYEPPAPGYEPPAPGYEPRATGYEQPATGYAAPPASVPVSSAPVSGSPATPVSGTASVFDGGQAPFDAGPSRFDPGPTAFEGGASRFDPDPAPFDSDPAPFDGGRSSVFGASPPLAAGRATPPSASAPSTGPTGPTGPLAGSTSFDAPTPAPIADPTPEPVEAEPEEPEFVPANQVEESLLDAAGEGSTDRFLSTMLLAKVLVPGPLDDPIANIDQWRTEQIDGQPYVVVFTSTEMLTNHLGEGVPATWIKFTQLIHAWPHETLSFAVNPGTPIGATLPGGQIVALASWADDVGLTDEQPEPTSPAAEPEPADRSAPPQQTGPVVMQKTISSQQVPYYLDRGYDRVSGFVHRASEVSHLRTPADLYNALGLSYSDSPFKPDDAEVYVLRWAAHRGNLYRIPYGGQHEAAMHAMQGWVIERSPFRGNGFAPSESRDVIAEFKVDSVRLPHGAELWRVDRDGNEKLVAMFDADGPRWQRVGEES